MGTPEARSRLCVCRASFLMTLATGGVPHAGSWHWFSYVHGNPSAFCLYDHINVAIFGLSCSQSILPNLELTHLCNNLKPCLYIRLLSWALIPNIEFCTGSTGRTKLMQLAAGPGKGTFLQLEQDPEQPQLHSFLKTLQKRKLWQREIGKKSWGKKERENDA